MNDLPMLNISTFGIRDAYAAINLLPGAGEMSPGSWMGTLRVNGLPDGTESVRIDGQDATENAWSAAYNMAMPGMDSIEETAIQTRNYSAEFGQAGGAVFNMTMRSGTNRLHGSAYEYLRNDALDARQPYNHYLPVDMRQWQWTDADERVVKALKAIAAPVLRLVVLAQLQNHQLPHCVIAVERVDFFHNDPIDILDYSSTSACPFGSKKR